MGTHGSQDSTLETSFAVLLLAVAGCNATDPEQVTQDSRLKTQDSAPWFTDIAAESGLGFRHSTGARGEYLFTEITGAGCGLLDYDGDGDLDVYAVQSAGANRLFRNDLGAGGAPRFVDVTAQAGVGDEGYGMGVAAGDYDNDGDPDLYVTNFGPNRLYRNDGSPGFTDVSPTLPAEDRWSTSSAFVDYDQDGHLDLFVTNYVNFSAIENKVCHGTSGRRDYCGPQSFDPVPDRLFRNNGDGTFSDVTGVAGIDAAFGSGLGVGVKIVEEIASEPDPYGNPNLVMRNLGPPDFAYAPVVDAGRDVSRVETSRGAAFGDIDNDGDVDVLVSTSNGPLRLLRNDAGGGRPWLTLRLVGRTSNRPAIGARVEVMRPGRPSLVRIVHAASSYASTNDLRVQVPADEPRPREVRVTWPSGLRETFALSSGPHAVLEEGTGKAVP